MSLMKKTKRTFLKLVLAAVVLYMAGIGTSVLITIALTN